MKWRGYLSTFEDCEADTEQEAERKMFERLAERVKRGEGGFTVWQSGSGEQPKEEGQ